MSALMVGLEGKQGVDGEGIYVPESVRGFIIVTFTIHCSQQTSSSAFDENQAFLRRRSKN